MPATHRLGALATCLLAIPLGCQGPDRMAQRHEGDVRTTVRIHDASRRITTWAELIEHVHDADVVVLGEQHDDATGHAVQLAVVEDVLAGGSGALALEMLERDEQGLVLDYREGIIDEKTFAKLTASASWAGPGSWDAWYQPIIDAAIERDAGVIAANAPRRYVRLARTGGWERLQTLDQERRGLAEHPSPAIVGPYRDRFMSLMSDHGDDGENDAGGAPPEMIEALFRSQQVWDATMAGSVSTALGAYGGPIVLLVGRFHSDAEGGTVQQLRQRLPSARIVTISLEPACEDVDWSSIPPQADFIVCTGD